MVTPENQEPTKPRGTGRGRLAAAALVLVAAVAIIAGQTQPSVPSPEDTTDTTISLIAPTTSVAFVAQGEPLEFEVAELDGYPLALMETGAGDLVLAQAEVQPDGISEVKILSSPDGISWQHMSDPIGPPNRAYGAAVTDAGLVVHGQDGSGAPTLWTSEDGRSWNTITLDPDGRWPVHAVGVTEDLMLAYGFSGPWIELESILRERFGEFGRRYQTVSRGPNGPEVVLHSPLGFPLARFTATDLGMESTDFEDGDRIEVRASRDGVEWYNATLPDTGFPGELFRGDDGELWTVRHEDFTSRLFSTTDGLTWRERGDAGASNAQILPWREGLLSLSPDMRLRTSVDGVDWSDVTLRDLFAAPNEWYPQPLAATDAGIAVLARLWPRTFGQEFVPDDSTFEFEHQGLVVRITPSLVTVFDTDREAVLVNVARWTSAVSSAVSFDEEAGTVTIHREPGGEALVTFTVDELAELETETDIRTANPYNDSQYVLMTSADGCSWTTQELALPDPTSQVYSGVIVGDRLALSVANLSYGLQAEAQLWWAELPLGGTGDCVLE